MVRVNIKFMSIARQRAGVSAIEFSSPGNTLRDVLKAIVRAYKIEEVILSEAGDVRSWARVLVNGRSHEFVGGLEMKLHDGDDLALIYPYTENF